jgi:hypothetical protein
MRTILSIIKLVKAAKPYAPMIAAVASGLAMIASKNYSEGLSTIFQALSLVFGGATAASLHNAATKPAPGRA